jgi:hypothetical protein
MNFVSPAQPLVFLSMSVSVFQWQVLVDVVFPWLRILEGYGVVVYHTILK